jgi:hypothetical protein
MRLNGEKTFSSSDVVNSSIKKDKLHQIIHNYQPQKDLRKQLLVIKNLADNYPNSGSLTKVLNEFNNNLRNAIAIKDKNLLCIRRDAIKEIKKHFQLKKRLLELVSILTSIALKNPKIYPIFASILSTIICSLNNDKKEKIVKLVVEKFKNKSNSEDLFLWLQRIAIVANIEIKCKEKLFELVRVEHSDGDIISITYEHLIWNSEDWLQVAQEEAVHFALIRDHLRKYNIDYGDLPAHQGLWEHAQDTAGDILARLAIIPRCMEARGLDVTPTMIEKFRHINDQQGVNILERIYHDEQQHVQFGSDWFYYQCQKQQLNSDQTFQELILKYYKSKPKGPFNKQVRLKVGFSENELAWLENQ